MQQLFLQDSIAVLIGSTRRRIKQVAWELLRPWEITPQQAGVILVLYSDGTLSLSDIAHRIYCDNPTACRIVTKLLDRGLVLSEPHPSDRRRFNLHLTPEGKKLGRDVMATANDLAAALEAGFSKDDCSTLRRLLRQVMQNMDAMEISTPSRRPAKAGRRARHAP